MMTVDTSIRPSTIEGLGVFANEFIPKGAVIWKLDSRFDIRLPVADIATIPPVMQSFVRRYGYPHMQDPRIMVVELDNGRYMNHCMQPNTDFTDANTGFAIKDIYPGEELTCNYFEFDKTFDGGFDDNAVASVRQADAVPA